jgi:ribosomal protein L40E
MINRGGCKDPRDPRRTPADTTRFEASRDALSSDASRYSRSVGIEFADKGGDMMRCSKCGRDNPSDARFCVSCGSGLAGRCPKCGTGNPEDARFCKQCGAALGAESEKRKAQSARPGSIVVLDEDESPFDGPSAGRCPQPKLHELASPRV